VSPTLRLALIATAACGRVGFEATTDASAPGGPANRAFVTSVAYTGALGGVAGGDAICMQHATNAGLAGTFIAWLGVTSVSPLPRIASSRGWRLVDDTPLADHPSDFATVSLLSPFALDEFGNDVRLTTGAAWSGTFFDGSPAFDHCSDWTTSSVAVFGNVGDPALSVFAEGNRDSCEKARPLYCLEIGSATEVAVSAQPARLAFVSASLWRPNAAGIPSADALCMANARDAKLTDTFLAYLPSSTGGASSRFSRAGAPWRRVDGPLLAATANDLFEAPLHANFLDRAADGTVVNTESIWSGPPNDPSMYHCDDFTDPTPSKQAQAGNPASTRTLQFFNRGGVSCGGALPLLCLQQ
jgi:hypothetical protein